MNALLQKDINLLSRNIKKTKKLPTHWDGKACVLELKEADYNWRQIEWWALYFEYKCIALLRDSFQIPVKKYNNVMQIQPSEKQKV